ncbi:hypothetical protein [Nocardiopsis synnemataformans]|uniref:hypothetical protein n=1 Tax=Nocardiopsis synnemataformans TaxID=61305 RepID=UPI003EBA24AE
MMSASKTPVTSKNALFSFYSIESLSNAFTLCVYTPRLGLLRVFFLIDPELSIGAEPGPTPFDDGSASQAIRAANPALLVEAEYPRVIFHDLSLWAANRMLAKVMGLSDANNVNDQASFSTYTGRFRPVCDTDNDYDPFHKHPYLAGYNSANYDTVMLALYLMEAFSHVGHATQQRYPLDYGFLPPKPLQLREWNDVLFQESWQGYMPRFLVEGPVAKGKGRGSVPYRIRQAMISSGRHLDVARFNESQQTIGLKRLLGGLGRQISASETLGAPKASIAGIDELYQLLSYNVSDVVGLSQLFEHPAYSSGFDLKKSLLDEYPETIYERRSSSYQPDIAPERVRKDRLAPDSSSAKFVGRILAPYEPLKDIEGVSYLYPSEQIARTTGIKQVNVLEEARRFFYDNIHSASARAQFDQVYAYYKSIEGKNFNRSALYDETWGLFRHPPHEIKDIPKRPNNLPYFHADGTPSSCYATFSTGGLHGAELNLPLFEQDEHGWYEQDESSPVHSSRLLQKAPDLFEHRSDGSTKLKARYVYTSSGKVIRQDFKSYYPLLLRNMGAFDNPNLGVDRYAKLYAAKELYGKRLKDSRLHEAERERLKVLREGTKLILNAASGVGDAQFSTSIPINNRIVSMRIIGQLFCWRIGQAQALSGARIVSTNTDGLYSTLGATANNKVLEREVKAIGVDIETEPLIVVSKDPNNRLELAFPDNSDVPLWKAPIIAAAGSSLACHEEPLPTKRLAHPAVLDWALARYLRYVAGGYTPAWRDRPLTLEEPLDRRVGLQLMLQACSLNDPVRAVRLFQHLVAASTGKLTFPFAADPLAPLSGDGREIKNPRPLQHCNRVFVVRTGEPGACSLRMAGAWKITEASRLKRERSKQAPTVTEPIALQILRAKGFARTRLEAYQYDRRLLPVDQDVAVRKVPGLDPAWSVLIENGDLVCMPEARLRALLACLDLDRYVEMLAASFDNNWKRNGSAESN